MKPPIRIAVLHFSHETLTFLANDTTLADFVYPGSPARGEALLTCDPRGYMGGFVKMAREFELGGARRHRIAALATHRHRLRMDHHGGI